MKKSSAFYLTQKLYGKDFFARAEEIGGFIISSKNS